ncbi:MAG: hypothetical protein RLN94_15110 [Roseovarius sp.]|uniref:hypothetical protein n=1 Tax=Roseovarius sp. TaxID=1486281 RepID=UPI0032F02731
MDRTLTDLLAMDATARRFGCGLNPRLRAAIEADLRYPSRAAAAPPRPAAMAGPLPANVTRLVDRSPLPERKKA